MCWKVPEPDGQGGRLLGTGVISRSVRAAPKVGSQVTKTCLSLRSSVRGHLRPGEGKTGSGPRDQQARDRGRSPCPACLWRGRLPRGHKAAKVARARSQGHPRCVRRVHPHRVPSGEEAAGPGAPPRGPRASGDTGVTGAGFRAHGGRRGPSRGLHLPSPVSFLLRVVSMDPGTQTPLPGRWPRRAGFPALAPAPVLGGRRSWWARQGQRRSPREQRDWQRGWGLRGRDAGAAGCGWSECLSRDSPRTRGEVPPRLGRGRGVPRGPAVPGAEP